MKADSKVVLTGRHNLSGNEACIEGAFAAGCQFLGVYPILPSLSAINRFQKRSAAVEGTFIQMEDEISALATVLGAAWTGKKALNVTSGPGFSLMMEHIGLGVMLETPCVIINVQRAGPGEGLPNQVGQGDIMQARWGSHGDYELISLTPNSPQECFDLTIKAFNLSERFRVPVVVLSDQRVGNMVEAVNIPPAKEIELTPRRYYKKKTNHYLPFLRDKDMVPPIVKVGDGHRFHVTGLTHDERGYPIMNAECQEYCVWPLLEKINKYTDEIIDYEEKGTEDAEIIVLSYGITSRVVEKAIELSRKEGIKTGILRPKVIWPFPENRVRELSKKAKAYIVPEINYGQIVYEVDRSVAGNCSVVSLPYPVGSVPKPVDILHAIIMASKEKEKKTGIIEYE